MGDWRRGRRLLTAGLISGLVTLVGSPIASAATSEAPGKLKTRTATATLSGQNAIGTALAVCPKGTRALGGGYATSPAVVFGGTPTSIPIVFESFRASGRSWRASAVQLAGGVSDITAYVYCREGFGKVKQRSVSVPMPATARSEASATASCPKGAKAISGGFQIPAAGNGVFTYLIAQEMEGSNGWFLHAVRGGIDAPAAGLLNAYVYCSKRVEAAGVESASTSVISSISADVFAAATTPQCDKPKKPVGGGFRAPYVDSGANRNALFVSESQRVGRSWRVSGYSASAPAGTQLTLTALSYCT